MTKRLKDIEKVIPKITIIAKQSRDIYEKSIELPLLSRPILLHYIFEKLANLLILHTFRDAEIPYSHGLTYYGRKDVPTGVPIGDEPITIKKQGLFQCFHDCHSIDPSVYMQVREPELFLNDVINAGEINYLKLEYAVNHGGRNSYNLVDRTTGNKITIREIDREFMFIYAISRSRDIESKNGTLLSRGKEPI